MGQLSEEPLRTGTEDQIDEMKLCLVSHQITDNWSVSQSASQPRLDAPGQQISPAVSAISQSAGEEGRRKWSREILLLSFTHFWRKD